MSVQQAAFYYAGGSRIPLEPDDEYIAVDAERIRKASLLPKVKALLLNSGRRLRGNLFLVRRTALPDNIGARLEQEGMIQPVYQCKGSRLVILPEVRAEDASAAARARLRRWVETQTHGATIVEERGDRVVLRPLSGSGNDALHLANRIHEELAPEMVQVRMIRVLPRP